MDRAEKQEMVETLNDIFATSGSVVVARYKGLTVAQMTDLRRRMSGAGAKFKVIKNRLAKLETELIGLKADVSRALALVSAPVDLPEQKDVTQVLPEIMSGIPAGTTDINPAVTAAHLGPDPLANTLQATHPVPIPRDAPDKPVQ